MAYTGDLTYSQRYCDYVRRYRQDMKEAAAECDKQLKAIEKYKGSEAYTKEKQKIETAYTAKTKELKQNYGACISCVFVAMRKNANGKPLDTPTPEQLNLLTALKMRSTVSRDELRAAANAMRGNNTAMATLADIAAQHGYHSLSAEVAPLAVSALAKIDTIERSTNRLLSLPRLGVRMADRINTRRMGDDTVKYSDSLLDKDYPSDTQLLNAMMYNWGDGTQDVSWFENAVN